MQILFIGPLPPPITGQTYANQYASSGLTALGHKLSVIDFGANAKVESAEQQGRWHYGKIFSSFAPSFKAGWLIISKSYDIVYINPGLSFLGFIKFLPLFLVSKCVGAPVVIHLHGGYFPLMYHGLSSIRRSLIKLSMRCIDIVIVLGQTLKIEFETLSLAISVKVCENGIDRDLLLSNDELVQKIEARKKEERIKILFLSNLIRSKGILDLLDAVLLLRAQGVDVQCDVAGTLDAECAEEFLDKIDAHPDLIHFHGTVYGVKKKKLLKQADIFCLPTYYPIEGQPISILEAYGAGCAVITTKHAGIQDIFTNDENGFFCNPKDPQSIVDSVQKIRSRIDSMSRKNVSLCQQLYTQDKFVERLQIILESVVQSRKYRASQGVVHK